MSPGSALRSPRRTQWALVICGVAFILVSCLYLGRPYLAGAEHIKWPPFGIHTLSDDKAAPRPDANAHSDPSSLTHLEAAQLLWSRLQPLLDAHAPNTTEIPEIKEQTFSAFELGRDDEPQDEAQVHHGDVIKIRAAHRTYLSSLPSFPPHTPGRNAASRGIVSTAGGAYFPVFMVSLRMLRRTGTTLPVEVFLADRSEYETEVCDEVLPTLNAKCVVLSDIFNASANAYQPAQKISKYQYKIFAILFSSFTEVLFIDADNHALHPTEPLFDFPPYVDTGMLTWPDFWSTSVSPVYSLITGIDPIPRGVRASTESGQIMLSKALQWETLLLAAYYNYYGPSHYYSLLCQNGAGWGDKETFIPAAHTLAKRFHAVSEPVAKVGHEKHWVGGISTMAMLQSDPYGDYDLTSRGLYRAGNASVARPPAVIFLHANTPKWNPKHALDHPGGAFDLTLDALNEASPAFRDPPDVVGRIEGAERLLWEQVRWVGCELEHKLRNFEGERDICAKITEFFETRLDVGEEEAAGGGEQSKEKVGLLEWPKEPTKVRLGADGKVVSEEPSSGLVPDDRP